MTAAKQYPCLMYHEISSAARHKYYVEPSMFRRHMEYLKANGYHALRLDECKSEKYDKPILITFDDGHVSNFSAAEFMVENGMKGVFYIIKDLSMNGAPDYLTPNQIKRLTGMGHEIGVHGRTHDAWTSMSRERLVKDLSETQRWIEEITGRPCVGCSAPGGLVGKREIAIIRKELPSIQYIRTSRPWWNGFGSIVLNSVPCKLSSSFDDFVNAVEMRFFSAGVKLAVYNCKNVVKRFVGR